MKKLGLRRIWRRGFTLVELLTVMVIIGILVGLITVAVIAARQKAMVARVGVEIAGLEQALNSYRDKFGDYPPDCGDLTTAPTAVRQAIHAAFVQNFSRAFPRYVISGSSTEAQWSNLRSLLNSQFSIDIMFLDPTGSLAFFLGGPPEIIGGQFTGRLIGFSANPTNPFDRNAVGPFSSATAASQAGDRIPSFFEFDATRLVRNTAGSSRNWFRYQPPYGTTSQVPPYVYFRAPYYYPNGNQPYVLEWRRLSAAGGTEYELFGTASAQPSVRPYYNETTSSTVFGAQKFFNPRSFQIICAGANNDFGGWRVGLYANWGVRFPISDLGISGGYLDNQANFIRGVLEDMTK